MHQSSCTGPPSRAAGESPCTATARTGFSLGTDDRDHDLVVFLEGAGVTDPEAIFDDLEWVEWRGGHLHEFHAA